MQRRRAGKRTPAPIQRIASEDLISVVFPDQLACLENIQGEREVPDHPLVNQTLDDCLHEAMDIGGLEQLLKGIESGAVKVVARDLPQPSPLAQEILSARPYAFLDDAPLEERRTQAVASRRWLDPKSAAEFGQLNPQAIAAVREEAWPQADTADELHDALMTISLLLQSEGTQSHWQLLFEQLQAAKRACVLTINTTHYWVAVECLPMIRAAYSQTSVDVELDVPRDYANREWQSDAALMEIVRGRLQAVGPTTVDELSRSLEHSHASIEAAMLALEVQGFVLRGTFTNTSTSSPSPTEWCERRLLARIHRYTLQSLRAEIEPV